MSAIAYCGAAFLVLALSLILGETNRGIKGLFVLCASTLFLTAACAVLYPSFESLASLIKDTPFADCAGVLFKALGVALAVEFTADICRDAGEGALASKLETVGKAELLLLALPLFESLLTKAQGLLS